jgi:hypothetical protein
LDLKEVRRSCLEKASFAWCRSIRDAEFRNNSPICQDQKPNTFLTAG